MFCSTAFLCECGHSDIPEHPGDGPCTVCECPKFKWAREDETKPAVSKTYRSRAMAAAVERVLDVIAPKLYDKRIPLFEWGHETTPTLKEVDELAEQLVKAVGGIE